MTDRAERLRKLLKEVGWTRVAKLAYEMLTPSERAALKTAMA